MSSQPDAVAAFYQEPLGRLTAALLRARLAALWPATRGERVLGIGWTAPFLDLWRDGAERCAAAAFGRPVPGAGCAVDAEALPFPDLSFDRVLLVHGLEAADNRSRLMREIWRVMKDGGRLLVVAPNRAGLWAHVETTPFGHGQPYSPGQIGRLLEATLFRVERRDQALFFLPVRSRLLRSGAWRWERIGRSLLPGLAGVTLTEATKDMVAAVPADAQQRPRIVLAEAA